MTRPEKCMRVTKNGDAALGGGVAASWLREVVSRLATLTLVKALGTATFMILFFWAYLYLLRHPMFPVQVMPVTGVDRWVSFTPMALPLYLSLWFYVSLPTALFKTWRDLVCHGGFVGGLCLLGVAVFLVWPTAVPVASTEWGTHPGIPLIMGVDAAGNACPSLHVATAVFSALWLASLLLEIGAPRWLWLANWCWCVGIVYSTLAVRQHVFIDVVAGALLGGAVGVVSLLYRRRALPLSAALTVEVAAQAGERPSL